MIIVPEVDKASQSTGLTLLHVRFHDFASPAAMRGVLDGYRDRYAALQDAVTETEPEFDESVLGRVPVTDLLTRPIQISPPTGGRERRSAPPPLPARCSAPSPVAPALF